MGIMVSVVALPFSGLTGGLLLGVPIHVLSQRLAIGMVAHAPPTVPTVSAHGSDDGRAIIVIRPLAPLFVGAPPRRIKWIAVFVPFFPPHSETSPRFRSRHPATPAGLT